MCEQVQISDTQTHTRTYARTHTFVHRRVENKNDGAMVQWNSRMKYFNFSISSLALVPFRYNDIVISMGYDKCARVFFSFCFSSTHSSLNFKIHIFMEISKSITINTTIFNSIIFSSLLDVNVGYENLRLYQLLHLHHHLLFCLKFSI